MKKSSLLNKIYPLTEYAMGEFRKYIEKYCPDISAFTVGKSILSRSIMLYRIGEGKTNVLYVGAHHGSEHMTASSLLYLIYKLVEKKRAGKYKKWQKFFSEFCVNVIPVVNPDGVELAINGPSPSPLLERQLKMVGEEGFLHWQANARGVDLNHNYDYRFYEYKKIEREREILPGRTLYSGEYPESEPETSAIMRLIRTIDFSLIVSLHSQGEEIYYYPKDERSEKIAKKAEKLSGYLISDTSGTASYGGLCDYTGRVMKIPSLTLEIGRGINPLSAVILPEVSQTVYKTLSELPFALL